MLSILQLFVNFLSPKTGHNVIHRLHEAGLLDRVEGVNYTEFLEICIKNESQVHDPN